MSEYMFPTETIDLPSEGKFYPEGHPLRSGKIDIKYMTAKEEDILTSTNLIQKGIVIDKLMESLIVSKGVKHTDLLLGDMNAVMIASRILAYGKDYPVQFVCTSCGKKIEHVVDLSSLDTVSSNSVTNTFGEFDMVLPSGVSITFKLLSRKEEIDIEAEATAIKKLTNSDVAGDSVIRLSYIITSVNGNKDKKVIRQFAENMIIRDVRALREEYKKVSPDVNFDLTITCESCETDIKARLPIGPSFFWPDLGV